MAFSELRATAPVFVPFAPIMRCGYDTDDSCEIKHSSYESEYGLEDLSSSMKLFKISVGIKAENVLRHTLGLEIDSEDESEYEDSDRHEDEFEESNSPFKRVKRETLSSPMILRITPSRQFGPGFYRYVNDA